jgi:hypothetical protein
MHELSRSRDFVLKIVKLGKFSVILIDGTYLSKHIFIIQIAKIDYFFTRQSFLKAFISHFSPAFPISYAIWPIQFDSFSDN